MSSFYNRDAMADLMSSLATSALNAQIPGASAVQQAAQGVGFTNRDGGGRSGAVSAGDAGKSNVGMQYITPAYTTQGRITPFATTDTSSSTSQGPDLFQALYDMGAFDTQDILPLDTSSLDTTGGYGFSVGDIGSNANLTDAIPTVTTPGFSIGNTDNALIGPNRPGVGFLTNMTPVYDASTLDNQGFQLNPGSALVSTPNFDALNNLNMGPFQDDSSIEEINVTGQRLDQGNTVNLPSLNALDTTLDLGGGDGGDEDPREPDADPSTFEEIVTTVKGGLLDGANTVIPGLPLFKAGYDLIKDLPEGDFTSEELDTLKQASDAANVYVDPDATFTEGGTGTTTTPGGVNVPGLGIGSLGGSRGFVGTQDVLVPATGQMGDIYSIRPGDTRGRFAAPAYVNPYAPVSAPGGEMRTMPIGPIAAVDGLIPQPDTSGNFSGTAVTDQGSQTTGATDFYTARDTNNTGQTLTVGGTTTPQSILDSINAEDGFSRDEQKQIADLLSSGDIGIGNVTNQFGVESGDVVEGLLRGGFQTPEQLTEMIRGYGNEGFEEKDLIADLLNQGRTTPGEVAGYYSANRPEFADLTPEAVTGYLDQINTQRLQDLSDVEVGKLIDTGQMTPGQAVEIYQTRYPGLKESDVMASLNQMKSQSLFAAGGVVEKADGIESLLDKRQQAVNRMLSKRAVAQFRDGGAVVKKPLAPANFAGGGIATKLIQKGAEMLGFDDARQIEITREAVDLTNQMVDAGLVDPQFRVKLRMPTSGEQSTRQNTGIEGDEEVFNAVNHALFSYHAGKSPLARAGSQAKEIYQGIRLAGAGKDPGSESLDYFNNMFGFDLARQGLSPEEAKNAIIDNIANINNQGAMSRLQAGEPLIAGKDLSRTAEDIRGSGPDVSAFDVLAGVQGLKDGGDVRTLQQRLDEATPLERYTFETLGLEPGLDRGTFLPFAERQSGEKEVAFPGLIYDTLKAMMGPGAAAKGIDVTPDEAVELAMETMGGGSAMPGVDIGADVMAGMAAKPKGGVFVPMRPEEDPFSPRFNMFNEPSYYSEAGQETIPANYGRMLVEAGMDEELAMDIAKRAENYFKKSFGTGSDPLKLKILEGQIDPNVEGLELSPDYIIPSDLLMQARKDYAEAKTDPSKANSPALMQFEEAYDRATNIRGEANLPEEGYRSARKGLVEEQAAKMEAEGVRPAFQNQPAMGPIDLEDLTPEMLENPTLRRALEEGEAIYDIYPYGLSRSSLDVILPEETIQGIMTLSPEKLKNMSFPDIIANAQKSVEAKDVKTMRNFSEELENQRLNQLEQAPATPIAVQQILQGPLPDPEFLLEKGVDRVVDLDKDSWFKITNPLYTKLEGALMDHSVGGYAEPGSYNLGGRKAIESGRAGVFSLRNNQTGRPRVTVEIDYSDPDRPKPTKHMYGPQNSAIQAKDFDNLFTLFDEVGVFPQDLPQYLQEPYKKFKNIGTSDMLDYFGIDPEV